MEIRTLRYFLAVAREENMTRAAETLHVTQPTLSKTLKALEEELGKKLFTRKSFSIRLTDEGMLAIFISVSQNHIRSGILHVKSVNSKPHTPGSIII